MATSVMTIDTINFKDAVATSFCKMTATPDVLTMSGTASAAVEIKNVATPTLAASAATKAYVDSVASGSTWKEAVRVATTADGVLATAYANGQTVDSIVLVTGDRILLKNQASGVENGIYTVNASGAPTRGVDLAVGASAAGIAVFVTEGINNADTAYVCITDPPNDIVNTDAIAFTEFTRLGQITAGDGIDKTVTTISVDSTVVRTTGAQSIAGIKTFTDEILASMGIDLPDNQSIDLGTADSFILTQNGANSLITSSAGDFIVDNTATSSASIMRLGTNTTTTAFKVQDNTPTDLFVVDGSGAVNIPTGSLNLADNVTFNVGTGNDFNITHDETDTLIISTTGDLTFDNQDLTGLSIFRLGTDTNATAFQIRNDSDNVIFEVKADGTISGATANWIFTGNDAGIATDLDLIQLATNLVTITGNLDAAAGLDVTGAVLTTAVGITNTAGEVLISDGNLRLNDNVILSIGTGGDLQIIHNITDTIVTSITGNLIFDKANANGATTFQLPNNTATTEVNIKNLGGSVFTVKGDATVTATGVVSLTNATSSTSTSTGALIVTGGVGIGENCHMTGSSYALSHINTSDERLKKDITPMETQVVDNLNPVSFNWIEGHGDGSGDVEFGFIAQQVEEHYPNLVKTNAEGAKSMNYIGLIAILVKEVKDLKLELAELKK